MPVYFPGNGLPAGVKPVGYRSSEFGAIAELGGLGQFPSRHMWRPGLNQLVKVWPTPVCTVSDRDGNPKWTAATAAVGGSVSITLDKACPLSGSPSINVTVPAGATTQYQNIDFFDLPPIECDEDTIWQLPVEIPYGVVSGALRVQVLMSDLPTITGSSYRSYNFDVAMMHPGKQILSCLNREIKIASTEYGVLGTTYGSAWSTTYGSPTMTVRSIRLRIFAPTVAPEVPINVNIGNLCMSRSGWAVSPIIIGVDDFPVSVVDNLVPLLERYGIPLTGNLVNTYASDTLLGLKEITTVAQAKSLARRGHELLGHTNRHDNLLEGTEAERRRAVRAGRDMWLAQGCESAARILVYPNGSHDESTIAMLKEEGYTQARATHGLFFSPAAPNLAPYSIPAFSLETENTWWQDAGFNGMLKRGQGAATYGHNAIAGGRTENKSPAFRLVDPIPVSFYVGTLERVLETILLPARERGECVFTTHTDAFRLAGIDPLRPQ